MSTLVSSPTAAALMFRAGVDGDPAGRQAPSPCNPASAAFNALMSDGLSVALLARMGPKSFSSGTILTSPGSSEATKAITSIDPRMSEGGKDQGQGYPSPMSPLRSSNWAGRGKETDPTSIIHLAAPVEAIQTLCSPKACSERELEESGVDLKEGATKFSASTVDPKEAARQLMYTSSLHAIYRQLCPLFALHRPALAPVPAQRLTAAAAATCSTTEAAAATEYVPMPPPPPALHAAIMELMGSYARGGARDWRQFALFNSEHYVRHLVDSNEDFELMLVCWRRGQKSRVHNHGASHCWMMTLAGQLQEVRYATPHAHAAAATHASTTSKGGPLETQCPALEETGRSVLQPGDMAYIRDALALHLVECPADGEEDAVSLHCYAPPIRRVLWFEPESQRISTRIPGFYSMHGVRT